MPQLDPNQYVTVTSDSFTQVRDEQGRLLGAIPKIDEDRGQLTVTDSDGNQHEIGYTMQLCVLCNTRTSNPNKLPGFIPLDARNSDLADPVAGGHGVGGDDPDLAEAV